MYSLNRIYYLIFEEKEYTECPKIRDTKYIRKVLKKLKKLFIKFYFR